MMLMTLSAKFYTPEVIFYFPDIKHGICWVSLFDEGDMVLDPFAGSNTS
jgi:hypothetical protein